MHSCRHAVPIQSSVPQWYHSVQWPAHHCARDQKSCQLPRGGTQGGKSGEGRGERCALSFAWPLRCAMQQLRLSGSWEPLPPPPGGRPWADPRALTVDKRGYVYWADGPVIYQCVDGVGDRRAREAHCQADEHSCQPVVVFHRGEKEVTSLCTTPGGWLCACEPHASGGGRLSLYSRAIPRAAEVSPCRLRSPVALHTFAPHIALR